MGNLNNVLQELRAERKQAQVQIEKLDQAISVIESLNGAGTSRQANQPTRSVCTIQGHQLQLQGVKWPWRNKLDGRRFGRHRSQQL